LHAQQAAMPVIGFLHSASPEGFAFKRQRSAMVSKKRAT
jgi:hypothetical protein